MWSPSLMLMRSLIASRHFAMIRSLFLARSPQVVMSSQRFLRNLRPPPMSQPEQGRSDENRVNGGEDPLDLIPQLSGRERRLAAILLSYSFTRDHVKKIIEHFRYKSSLYEFEPETVTESIKFWLKHVHPDQSRRLSGTMTNFDYSDSRYADAISLRDTLANNDPNLLLINTKMMEKRIDNLRKIGFLSGKKDLWTVFISAPAAFFLQDWAEFNRKYYYLQHRVMEWMIDVHHNPFPTPHPCVRYPAVFELPYETLKSRFEFALKTGLKSPVAAMKDSSTKKNKIDVQSLFLYPLEDYLTTIAPAVTEEEYYVFERMVEEYPDEEDRTILEIVRLQVQGQGQALAKHQRIELEEDGDDDSDSDSDESRFRRTHKLTECLPSGKRKVYKISFDADEEAARKRQAEKLTKLSE